MIKGKGERDPVLAVSLIIDISWVSLSRYTSPSQSYKAHSATPIFDFSRRHYSDMTFDDDYLHNPLRSSPNPSNTHTDYEHSHLIELAIATDAWLEPSLPELQWTTQESATWNADHRIRVPSFKLSALPQTIEGKPYNCPR